MAEKLTPTELIMSVTTPIFTPEMGHRMSLARMKLLLDQAEMGAKLGISQQALSRLESGRQCILKQPFTTAKFREAFGNYMSFVLFGTGEERFPPSVKSAYWKAKNAPKGNRGDRSKFWEAK